MGSRCFALYPLPWALCSKETTALLFCSATAVYNLLSSQGRCHICFTGFFCCTIPYKGWVNQASDFSFFHISKESQHQLPTTKSNDLMKLLAISSDAHRPCLALLHFSRPQKEQERQLCQEFANHRKLRLFNRTGTMVATETVCSAPHAFPVLQPLTSAVGRLLHPATAFRYWSMKPWEPSY